MPKKSQLTDDLRQQIKTMYPNLAEQSISEKAKIIADALNMPRLKKSIEIFIINQFIGPIPNKSRKKIRNLPMPQRSECASTSKTSKTSKETQPSDANLKKTSVRKSTLTTEQIALVIRLAEQEQIQTSTRSDADKIIEASTNLDGANALEKNEQVRNSIRYHLRTKGLKMNISKYYKMLKWKPENSSYGKKLDISVRKKTETKSGITIPFEDFHVVDYIGHGGFGTVSRVISLTHCMEYAMKKSIYTSTSVSLNDVPHIDEIKKLPALNELAILQKLSKWKTKFIVRMYSHCRHENDVCLILDLAWCDLTDMSGHMRKYHRYRRMPEDITRFYVAELVLALEYLHSQLIIHHDIKLENILIDFYGHVLLADFGVSTQLKKKRSSATISVEQLNVLLLS